MLLTRRREVITYKDIGDEGEIWYVGNILTRRFGEDSEERMIRYLCELFEEERRPEARYILDLGTGNGHFLFALMDAQMDGAEGMEPGTIDPNRLCGMDYSAASVQLAKAIAEDRGKGCDKITFIEADLRNMSSMDELARRANNGKGWDIVCDKGTVRRMAILTQYDAVRALYLQFPGCTIVAARTRPAAYRLVRQRATALDSSA